MAPHKDVDVPALVPKQSRSIYEKNYITATRGTGRIMILAGDQKIEHLNEDFYGEGISADDNTPEHLFRIASQADIGVFAAQLGLISKYGMQYPKVPYLVKLNSKTHLVKTEQQEPLSRHFNTVEDVIALREASGLNVVGVGCTIYVGSGEESTMLVEASQAIVKAHQAGLIAVVWSYSRGKAVKDEKDPNIVAGAAGLAACLGADFAKVNPPKAEGKDSAELLKQATMAAGKTGVICAGGSSDTPEKFLEKLHKQIHIGGTRGSATGRNIHQRPLAEAIRLSNAISALTYDDASLEDAIKIYKG